MLLVNHLLAALGVGVGGGLVIWLLGGNIYHIGLFTLTVVLANAIDFDHYTGDGAALLRGGLAVTEAQYWGSGLYLSRKEPHNLQVYGGVMVGLLGFAIGYTLHLRLDGLL